MKKPADWVAWVLQFVFGFIVGMMFTVLMVLNLRSMRTMISEDQDLNLHIGVGLIVAALATRYGDRMWMYDTFKVIPPDEPQSNRVSRAMSLLTGLAGCATVVFALF